MRFSPAVFAARSAQRRLTRSIQTLRSRPLPAQARNSRASALN